jgi:hypothetical protein
MKTDATRPTAKGPHRSAGLLFVLMALACLTFASSAGAAPGFLTSAPEDPAPGEAAGQLSFPIGIVVNPNLPGDVYVVDHGTPSQPANRVSVYSPWGEFVKAFGWGVDTGAAAFETCTATSTCQAGVAGSGPGQFDRPDAIAVNSAGDLYVAESTNHRVQKFDSDGNFLLMFGDGVDATSGGDVCTAASGDTCQAGTAGSGPGQFGLASPIGYEGQLAGSPSDGSVFVGEKERIQKFDPNGAYEETIAMPAGKNVEAITTDASKLYVVFEDEPRVVHTLEPGGPSASFLEPSFTVPTGFIYALTPNPAGGLYATIESRAFEFDPSGVVVSSFDLSSDGSVLWGIGTGSACGPTDVYTAHFANGSPPFYLHLGYFNVFGAPPNSATCPQPPAPPTITDSFVASVDTEEAELKAKINPNFWADTTYYLEYGTAPCSGGGCDQQQPTAPGETLTSQVIKSPQAVEVTLSNLTPDTTYHYRFVAQSSGGGPVRGIGGKVGLDGAEGTFHTYAPPDPPNITCTNQAFRSETPSALLPDCRAYEMVSPLAKGGDDLTDPGTLRCFSCAARIDQARPDGSALTFSAARPFANPTAAPNSNQYLSMRDPASGWQTRNISPPTAAVNFYNFNAVETPFQAFSPDLCEAYYWQMADVALTPGDQPGYADLYRVDTCQAPLGYQLLTSSAPIGNQPVANRIESYFPLVQGSSADGSRTVLLANAKLTPNASSVAGEIHQGPVFQLYLQDGKGLRLASVLPDGSASGSESTVGNGVKIGNVEFRQQRGAHPVSTDGTRIFWSSQVGASGLQARVRLFLRINADQAQSKFTAGKCSEPAKACTLAVSESVEPGVHNNARFWAATPDGSKALFSFDSSGGSHDGELYSYDVATQTSTLIASGLSDFPGSMGVGSAVLGTSEDLSKVYFLSSDALAPGASAGQQNLYLYEEGEGIRLIASGTEARPVLEYSLYRTSGYPYFGRFRVSADGERLAFVSTASLSGYDNADSVDGKPATEVFLYDASANSGAGELLCVSCNPSSSRPQAEKIPIANGAFEYINALIPGSEYAQHSSRVLSAGGDRLFFESVDPLLPTDENNARDVYEWEKVGSGDCKEENADYFQSNGGCLSLISTGQSPRDAQFIDASADGTDVFFKSAERLYGADTDTLIDIYDARAGGGFAAPVPPAPPCDPNTGACEGAGSSAPQNTGAGSAAFQGPGNTTANPAKGCPKGKRKVTHRGKARCVKPRHHKRAKHQRRASR